MQAQKTQQIWFDTDLTLSDSFSKYMAGEKYWQIALIDSYILHMAGMYILLISLADLMQFAICHIHIWSWSLVNEWNLDLAKGIQKVVY